MKLKKKITNFISLDLFNKSCNFLKVNDLFFQNKKVKIIDKYTFKKAPSQFYLFTPMYY